MVRSKELRPVQSKKLYEEKSKEMLKNVSIGAGWSCILMLRESVLKLQFLSCLFLTDFQMYLR